MGRRGTAVLVAMGVLVAACSSGDGEGSGSATSTTAAQSSMPTRQQEPLDVAALACDPVGGDRCLLPFPNDVFTEVDPATDTGRRLALETPSAPANASGVHIDVTEQNRGDGFSPGSALLADVPNVDLEASGAAPITDMARSLDDDAPIVLVDTATGERHPYWAELDANVDEGDEALLVVRPARNFVEGHRYVVGFRGLVDAGGAPIEATEAFAALRDGEDLADELAARQPTMERTLDDLEAYGVERGDLQLAWDFTVASERSLSERLLHMRDDAFEQLGDAAPGFAVTEVEPGEGAVLQYVRGTFEVPRYLTGDGATGEVLNNGSGSDDVLPAANGMQTANFLCVVPASAIGPDGAAVPSRMSLYGHGLLGEADQVRGVGEAYSSVSNTTFCATDWIGMAGEDVPTAVELLQDLSKFRTMADRLQQGILNFLFLGRLMKHPDGFSSDAAFQDEGGDALLDQEHLVFVGLSQGGILGGATSAVAQDWDRALLGVPAMNYGTLLERSIDFDVYAAVLDPAYPDRGDQLIALQLIQLLWDRGENNGYAAHLTADPYEGTEAKQVLLFEAFGDHQVTNVATEVMARTIGARLRAPGLADGRSPDLEPFWGIEPVPSLPDEGGSYLVMWDFGTPAPPTENVPNRGGDDPHGKGRDQPEVLELTTTFLDEGRLVDVCDAGPCRTIEDEE